MAIQFVVIARGTLADNYEWPSHINTERRFYGLCTVDEKDPSKS